jgi:alkaline phosphatase D
MISRRRWLSHAASAAATATLTRRTHAADDATPFRHGVASGDPLADRVILWTRVTTRADAIERVRWSIATDERMQRVVDRGEVSALPGRDHCVKVDALGLEPGRTYYYRFEARGERSPVGRTRTLPVATVARLKFAVASCANFPFGFFNAYACMAARDDLAAVLHLGDYLYEYAPGTYGDGADIGRAHLPAKEIVTLADYRTRYAQYRTDRDLQEAHRRHPWICVWDDHETANNSWRDGAENHNPESGEGTWADRRAAAERAWFEWLPVREVRSARGSATWRSFRFGSLADLVMLDTRLYGRSRQLVDRNDTTGLADSTRTLLGADQHAWLAEELRASKARGAAWHVIGQQCMFGQLLDGDRRILNVDQWDGYPGSREAVLAQLEGERIDDTVILTGDIHSSWALDVARDPFAGYERGSGRGSLAVELVTTSVTSPGPFGDGPDAIAAEERTVANLPHVQWVNFRERGYLVLDLDAERARAEWWAVETIAQPSRAERILTAMVTPRGRNHLVTA